eukprot:CAMPEP_0172423652 /NCGR_PEP_ID=MMETSP1064-20121228/17639_1 /TAXON_ID=202472 /ORGANISM="Aulacoseira subarctica , Strain CCAP 1002/5" /LENGTH=90 /DNA_ID=CAMNT_0013165121 /DNA_START=67 /DNA_END=335 /DNA_ORIENTATION=+
MAEVTAEIFEAMLRESLIRNAVVIETNVALDVMYEVSTKMEITFVKNQEPGNEIEVTPEATNVGDKTIGAQDLFFLISRHTYIAFYTCVG